MTGATARPSRRPSPNGSPIASCSRPLAAATWRPMMHANVPITAPAGRAAQVPGEVGAERAESDGDRDEAHDLAEQRSGPVVRDRLAAERRLVGDGVERAHVTTTTGTGRAPQRSTQATLGPSTMWS